MQRCGARKPYLVIMRRVDAAANLVPGLLAQSSKTQGSLCVPPARGETE
jgi:hypothetical protein